MSEPNENWLCPPSWSIIAGPPPLNWTILNSVFVNILKSSVPMCWKLPMPAAPQIIWPGFALKSASNSLTVLAGTLGWTVSEFGPLPSFATGVKDLIGSKGSL